MLLGYLLPLGFYLAILLVLGRLYIDNEMTVLSCCGMSWARIFTMVLTFALALMLVVAGLLLWVEPKAQDFRAKVLENSIKQASINKLIPSQFRELPDGGVFYAGQVLRAQQTMRNVFFAEKTTPAHAGERAGWDITLADNARVTEVADAPGQFLVFNNGYRYVGVPGEKQFRLIQYQNYGVQLMNSHYKSSDWPLNAPTLQLWAMRHQNRDAAAMLQWRLGMPISVILFALIAVPLSRVKPRQGKFAQFLPAIIIYIGYADLMFLGRAWIQRGVVSPELGLWWLHGAMLLLAVMIILQKLGWKRLYAHS